jgi:hypothetical protein
MRFFRKHAPRPACRPARSFRPTIESLEERQLLSATPVLTGGLHDALVARVARAEFVQDNDHLSRADVIDLLEVVDGTETAVFNNGQVNFIAGTPNPGATLTEARLTDLRTIVKDARAWGLSADVANLAGKLLNQNPANEQFQGSVLLPNGQLSAGTSDSVVQDLVGKWFYGSDLPAVSGDGIAYEQAQGVLFGKGGPRASDIAQGAVGDCYFMSGLGATATQAPATIRSMFINNGDGTYTVRFFEYDATNDTWRADYVTVNLELPVYQQGGAFVYAGWYQGGKATPYTSKANVLWPALAEKAYAQLAEEGWSRFTGTGGSGVSGTPADWNQNCYDALNSGDGVATMQITGSNITADFYLPTGTAADEQALIKDFNHGSLVTVGSLAQEPADTPTNAAGEPLIIATHVYFLHAVNATAGTFTLINPCDDGSGQRMVTLTWSQMQIFLNDAFVVNPPPIDPAHAVLQNGTSSGTVGDAKAIDVDWYLNGKPVSSLKDVCQGDTVTVTFSTAAGIDPTEFSLVSYAAPNGKFNSWNIDHQQEWADSTLTATGKGTYSLTVKIPNGFFQLDFVRGDAISDFATGERYHGDGRFIEGVQGGTHMVR